MAVPQWRSIPTVLYPQEILDKAFRKASKQSDLVEDPDKYHRVRKQMVRMIQSASDTIDSTLRNWVEKWPSLNALSEMQQLVTMIIAEVLVLFSGQQKELGKFLENLNQKFFV